MSRREPKNKGHLRVVSDADGPDQIDPTDHWDTGVTAPALRPTRQRKQIHPTTYGIATAELQAHLDASDEGRAGSRFRFPDPHTIPLLPDELAHAHIDWLLSSGAVEVADEALREHRQHQARARQQRSGTKAVHEPANAASGVPARGGRGPAPAYSTLAVLLGWRLCVASRLPKTRAVAAELLAYGISPAIRERLGLPRFPWHDRGAADPFADPAMRLSYQNQHYSRFCRSWRTLRRALEPKPIDVGHAFPKAELEQFLAARTPEQLNDERIRRARLRRFGDVLLANSQPTEQQLREWGPDIAVDETALESAAAFCKQDSPVTTSDPFMTHSYKDPYRVMGWGVTAAVLAPTGGQRIPIIARALQVHPSMGVNMDALRAVTDTHMQSHPTLAGQRKSRRRVTVYVDKGYGGRGAADHASVQATGAAMKWDLKPHQYDTEHRIDAKTADGDQPLGLVFGLGCFFTDDFGDDKITLLDTFRPLPSDADKATCDRWDADRRYLERRKMHLQAIETLPDSNGVPRIRIRLSPPCLPKAKGAEPKVACDRRPDTIAANDVRREPLPILSPQPRPDGTLPKICTQQTVSVWLDEYPALQRAFLSGDIAGASEFEDSLKTARAYSEGLFGATKNHYEGALATQHTMRGEVEFTLLCALALADHNEKALRRTARHERDGTGAGYIPRMRTVAQQLREAQANTAA
jgi:hypothetical protein